MLLVSLYIGSPCLALLSDHGEDAIAVFEEADADDNGSITFDEFTNHLADLRVQAFLRSSSDANKGQISCSESDALLSGPSSSRQSDYETCRNMLLDIFRPILLFFLQENDTYENL